MADESIGGGAGVGFVPVSDEPDPILEITGVAASDILHRCTEIRGFRSGGITTRLRRRGTRRRMPAPDRWRLLDFADVDDADFVRAAHPVLLGRSASPADLQRRLGELRGGASRMEIIVRLALCPEGRRARRPSVRGIGLPALVAAGVAIEAASASPALGSVARRGERVARSVLAGSPSPRSAKLIVVCSALAIPVAAWLHRS